MKTNKEIATEAIDILLGLDEYTIEEILHVINLMNITVTTAICQNRTLMDVIEKGLSVHD